MPTFARLIIALFLTGCNLSKNFSTNPTITATHADLLTTTPTILPTAAEVATPTIPPTATEVALVTERETPLSLPAVLTVEEYALVGPPSIEPLNFIPVQGSGAGILAKHSVWRHDYFPDNSFFDEMTFSMRADLGTGELIASEHYNQTGSGGWVELKLNGQEIYRIVTGPGSPLNALLGLWVYDDHWVLETAQITQRSVGNAVYTDAVGQISQDGELLNTRQGYVEMFGFQLMAGKPFYFFKQGGKIGISYDGQAVAAGYDEIPHYGCCSSAALNPARAMNMVSFFAQRENVWYYVEISVYQNPEN